MSPVETFQLNDPFLLRVGVTKAIRGTFESVTGKDDPEAALEWAVNLGWLVPHPEDRESVILTPQGEQIVWRWWKAYMEGRERSRGAIILPGGQG